jgi:hypothetical protein
MTQPHSDNTTGLLLMIAGAKGAIASTIAVSTAVLRHGGVGGLGGLTTADKFAALGPVDRIQFVGWDTQHPQPGRGCGLPWRIAQGSVAGACRFP